jgi:predicted SAM-dependent methyltransferase
MSSYQKFKQFIYRGLIPFIRIWKKLSWYFYLFAHNEIKLIIGAGPTKYKGWFPTDIITLDVTNENHFKKYFKKKKINKILAEHVLEHLTNTELEHMTQNFYKYSEEKVNIRIAVPDGFHKNESYINTVKPGGTGDGADDHKNLFNYRSLSDLFEKYGFKAKLVDYWDEIGEFHSTYSNDEKGYVLRSFLNDNRNKDGKPNYTSLIIDFCKYEE